jgi:hypothetical protein
MNRSPHSLQNFAFEPLIAVQVLNGRDREVFTGTAAGAA